MTNTRDIIDAINTMMQMAMEIDDFMCTMWGQTSNSNTRNACNSSSRSIATITDELSCIRDWINEGAIPDTLISN